MRRLTELFRISFRKSTCHGEMSWVVLSLIALAFFTFTAAQAQTMVTSTFEDGQLDGWVKNGSPATLEVSTDTAHSGTQSVKIAGRTGTDDSIALDLLPIMKPGESWEFSVWVKLAPGSAPDTVGVKVRDPATSDWGGYPVIANADNGLLVTDQAWVQLKGRYPLSGTLNSGGSELRMWLSTGIAATNLYVDDFVAWKQSPSGCYATPDTTGDHSDFETELNWAPRGWSGVTLSLTNVDKHSGSQSLLQSNRDDNWKTAGFIATGKMCNGSSYKVTAWVKMAPGMPAADMFLQAVASKAGKSDNYIDLSPTKTVTDQAWVELTGNFDMWVDYDILNVWVQPKTDKTSSFYIDDFALEYVPLNQAIESGINGIGSGFTFPVGAAVYAPDVTSGNVHADLLAKHFTSVTAENDMKWDATEPTENNFTYAKAQAIVDFAKANGMKVRGHALLWHQQTPDWVFKDTNGVDMSTLPYSDANKALLQSRLKNHIQTLIAHFGADVTSWDVVNEVIDESQSDGFRRSKWYTIYGGPGYIDDAFNYAKQAVDALGLPAGSIKLYINDYNTTIPSKLGFILSYLSYAKTNAIPVDGVGHQLHNKLDWPVNDDPASISSVTGAIDAVAALGFDNQVTEMEISIYRNLQTATTYEAYGDINANLQNDLAVQGYRYREYFKAFKQAASQNKLSSVTLWGEADDHTWLTNTNTADAPLPFDRNLTHKPAYTGIMEASTGVSALPKTLPYANDLSVTVTFNTAKSITLPARDADGDALTFAVVDAPVHGSLSGTGGTVTYTPTTGYFGSDSFTYKANDGTGDSNVGTIAITVLPAPAVAQNQSVQVDISTPKAITLVATGDGTITYSVASQPAHGTLTGTAPSLTYTPATDYTGPDTFTFKANNGTDSNTATVSITVGLQAPVAVDQSVTTGLNTAANIVLSATGQGTITYSVLTQPSHGTLTGTAPNLTYTPTKDYYGTDTLTFKANNGFDSNTGTVTITVRPSAPVAVAQTITVEYARPTIITLTAKGNLLAGGTMTFTIVKAPYYLDQSRGTLVAVPNSTRCASGSCSADFTYTATTANFGDQYLTQADTEKALFTFKVNNGIDSDPATVTITVKPAALMIVAPTGQETKATLNAGDSKNFNLQVVGFQNYTTKEDAPVSFVCGNLPVGATCTINPLVVSLNDNMTPVPFTVTIKTGTSAAAGAAGITWPVEPRAPWFPICALASFVAIFFATKKAKLQWRMVGAAAALLVVVSMTACGTNNAKTTQSNNMVTTAPGTYNVSVTAVATHTVGKDQLTDWKVSGSIPLTITVK